MKNHCAVPGCKAKPRDLLKVYVADTYQDGRLRTYDSYFGRDEVAPWLCEFHAALNELTRIGSGRSTRYPFTKGSGSGITVYKRKKDEVAPAWRTLRNVPKCSVKGCTRPTPFKEGFCFEHVLLNKVEPSTLTPRQPDDLPND